MNVGLENRIDRGWSAASRDVFVNVPGQVVWYEAPSKSLSVAKHPPTCTRSDALALKQFVSSPSRLGSSTPGLTQLPCVFAWAQYSKCPISSEKATL